MYRIKITDQARDEGDTISVLAIRHSAQDTMRP